MDNQALRAGPSPLSHPTRAAIAMSSSNINPLSELELHGLDSQDPGLCTNLDVAAGSNFKNCNADAIDVSVVKVGDKLLAKGPAPNAQPTTHPPPTIHHSIQLCPPR